MPNASKGQWRLAESIACAVYLDQIATGEIQETCEFPVGPNSATDSQRANEGGKVRAAGLTAARRQEIARLAQVRGAK